MHHHPLSRPDIPLPLSMGASYAVFVPPTEPAFSAVIRLLGYEQITSNSSKFDSTSELVLDARARGRYRTLPSLL